MTATPTRAMFDSNLNTKFQIRHEQYGDVDLELVDVTLARTESPGYESFSLTFLDAANLPFPQQTYAMKHDEMGEFDLFIVPVNSDARGRYYQAIFNRVTHTI
jgi:hypothetical protein